MNSLVITYFDTAMVLLEIGPLRLLTDPVFDAAGSTFDYGPVHLEKILSARATPQGVGRIDAVLLNHDQHGDNLDRGGRAFLNTVPLVVTTPLAASRLAETRSVGLESWKSTSVQGLDGFTLQITAVPAQHGPEGTQGASGPVTGFILTRSGQTEGPLYISGDTVLFEGTKEIAERFAPIGVAILHLGYVELDAMKGLHLSLSAAEAVDYAQRLQADTVIPVHCEGWRHFTEDAAKAGSVLASSAITKRVVWLRPGVPERIAANRERPQDARS